MEQTIDTWNPSREQAELGLRAMKTAATADGLQALTPTARAVLDAVQSDITHTLFDIDALPLVSALEIGEAFPDPAHRRLLIQDMIIIAMSDQFEMPMTMARFLRGFAQMLDVDEAGLNTLTRYVAGQHTRMRLDIYRQLMKNNDRPETLGEVLGNFWQVAKTQFGVRNPELAARYRALGDLPEGTLGRTLIDFYEARGFSVPGEKGGTAENYLVGHDCTHILGG
jgi:hypothetical protein